jgi:hypothetical protein
MSDSHLIIMVYVVVIMICFIADNRKRVDKSHLMGKTVGLGSSDDEYKATFMVFAHGQEFTWTREL